MKTLVDKLPFPWHDDEAEKCVKLLSTAYPSLRKTKALVASVTGLNSNKIDWSGGAPQFWRVILQTASLAGKVRALLNKVLADQNVAAIHRDIRRILDITSLTTTLAEAISEGIKWEQRVKVIQDLPGLTGDLRSAVELVWKFVKLTRHGADLWFARKFFRDVAAGEVTENLRIEDEAEVRGDAAAYAGRIFEHFSKEDLERARGMIRWVGVPGGEFVMGSPKTEKDRDKDETAHRVRFVCGFEVMDVPVTHALYECFDPDHNWDRRDFDKLPEQSQAEVPVYYVTWYEAQMFGEWIAMAFPGSRLPMEAEWEYFCRAGTETAYDSGGTEADLATVGWYRANSGGHPCPVRAQQANVWGLYDCHGNVWEWCLDEYQPYTTSDTVLDPRNLRSYPTVSWDNQSNIVISANVRRVCRGGSWDDTAQVARAACRLNWLPSSRYTFLGFRLVRLPHQYA